MSSGVGSGDETQQRCNQRWNLIRTVGAWTHSLPVEFFSTLLHHITPTQAEDRGLCFDNSFFWQPGQIDSEPDTFVSQAANQKTIFLASDFVNLFVSNSAAAEAMQEPGPSQNRRRDVQMVELFWVCLMDDRELSTKFRVNFSIFKESAFSFYRCISAKLNIEGNDGQLQGSLINTYL